MRIAQEGLTRAEPRSLAQGCRRATYLWGSVDPIGSVFLLVEYDTMASHNSPSFKRMTLKTALITGVHGMDGSHLADLLLEKGYMVYGMERHSSVKERVNVAHLNDHPCFKRIVGDLTDQSSLIRVLRTTKPHEIYNLAAHSFVGESWNIPEHTGNVTGLGVLRILEAIRECELPARFYQASSSEMFGRMICNPSNEDARFYPRSPYGVAKLYGHWITRNYRESHGIFTVSGILFNHESERRGKDFVTRKISQAVAMIHAGKADHMALGNLDASRDWGYAPDYVEAMWRMLQVDEPYDYVVATGVTRTIREFLTTAFGVIGVKNWEPYVHIDPHFMRPAEVNVLCGDASRIKADLGWQPSTPFETWVERMVRHDMEALGSSQSIKPDVGDDSQSKP